MGLKHRRRAEKRRDFHTACCGSGISVGTASFSLAVWLLRASCFDKAVSCQRRSKVKDGQRFETVQIGHNLCVYFDSMNCKSLDSEYAVTWFLSQYPDSAFLAQAAANTRISSELLKPHIMHIPHVAPHIWFKN